MIQAEPYQFLERRPGSNYKQLFVKGRGIRAEVLYRLTLGPEARAPEKVAEAYGLPLQAVAEAVEYCKNNEALLREEREREAAWIRAAGLDKPPFVPADFQHDS